MSIDIREYRGVRNLVYAELNNEGAEETYGAVLPLSGVQSIAQESDSASDTHFYDNKGKVVIDSEGADTLTLRVSITDLATRAVIEGRYWGDANQCLVGVKAAAKRYFALGFIGDTTDGRSYNHWIYKGKFGGGAQTHDTKDNGTNATNVEYTFTAIPTAKKYTIGGQAVPVKDLIMEEAALPAATFFANVLLPDQIPENLRLPDYTGPVSVSPSTSQQTLRTMNKSVTSNITVLPVTNTIDPNIQPENIREGVDILGVVGTVEGGNPPYEGATTVTPTTGAQTLATAGKSLDSDITINAVTAAVDPDITTGNIKNGVEILGVQGTYTYAPVPEYTGATSVTPSATAQTLETAGKSLASDVTISAVTASVDSDIKAANIKSGVDILGVAGNATAKYPPYTGSIEVTPSASQQVLATAGKSLQANIFIDAVTAAVDPDITPENIRSGVSILDVTGTAEGGVHYDDFTGPMEATAGTVDKAITGIAGKKFPSNFTVNAPTAGELDPNLTAGNIVKGINCFGTIGTYEGGMLYDQNDLFEPSIMQTRGVYGSTGKYAEGRTVTFKGFTMDNVMGWYPEFGADKIKAGVTILGVTGTYQGAGA